ncbi:MAG: sodium:solute symporter family protein [Deltaproteobacteria bacterium]|nr:sodium:solute symporter family protein [Deltaproteobacteria bacterium]
MTLASLGLLALVFYLAGLIGIAELARRARRDLSPADHFLAGRELGVFVLFLTLYATAYSGNSLLGYPGEAYRRGFSWIMATGFMMSIIVVFHLLVPSLRPLSVAHGFVTPGDYIQLRFGGERGARALRFGVAALMSVALANFLLAQLMAMGHVTHQITGGLLPYEAGVVGLAAMILFYEVRGGMRAVAWTDAAQGVLMLLGLMALLAWVLGAAGGLEGITRQILQVRPEAARVPDARECANWASTIILLGVASVVYPQAIQRIYAARTGAALKRSLALMTFMPLSTTAVVTLIGLAAIPLFSELGSIEADTVMPRLLELWAAAGPIYMVAGVLVFIGALAAIMSTADSVLLSLGSVVAEDLLGRSRLDPSTTRLGKRVSIGITIGVVGLALFPRFTLWRLIELKMELLIQCAPAFLVALNWRGLRAAPAFWGLLLGTTLAVGGLLSGVTRVAGVHVGVLGLGLNLTLALLLSLLAGRRPS